MKRPKSSIAAIGLATGAVALESVWPAFDRLFLTLNLYITNLAHSPILNAWWFAAQRILENCYYHLTVVNLWNYLVILVAVILEGPIATLLGGVWASMGRVNLWAILAVSMSAGMMADSFWYYLGYFGRERVIERWGRYLKVDRATVNRLETVLFGDDGYRVIFTAKLTSVLIIPTLVAAGMTNMGWRKVIKTMLAAQLLWSVGLTAVGFLAADSFMLINDQVEHFSWMVGGAIALLFIGRIVYRWRKTAHA